MYLVSLKTILRTKRQYVEEKAEHYNTTLNVGDNARETKDLPLANRTLQQMQDNLKLSMEISSRLSKILSDINKVLPDLKTISNELKTLRDKGRGFTDNRTVAPMKTLLTLFTSMNENNFQRALIYNNTIRNWASLRPMVNPVLFTNNDTLRHSVENLGWQILPLQRTGPGGMPILKYMYLAAIESFKSDFYAFSNCDILFDGGMLKTLMTAKYTYDVNKPMLITGTRYNVQNVTYTEAKERSNLLKIAKDRGDLFLPWAADYFVTTNSFPWKDIPEVIIGKLAYDNWLILYAREKKFLVIDATKTAPAVHQTPENGNFESHGKEDALYNYGVLAEALNKTIDYQKGQVICTEMVSSLENGNVIFEKRAESMPHCYFS